MHGDRGEEEGGLVIQGRTEKLVRGEGETEVGANIEKNELFV